jgi:hypothetical protein
MANADKPSGCRVVGSKSGYHEGQLTRMAILAADGTATFVNDIVKLSGTSDANGVPSIAQAAAGDTPVGIIVSFEVDGSNLELKHREASTLRYALVNTDPNVLFEIQEDSVGNSMPITDVGSNADVIVGTGSSISGLSAMELDSTTAATTATLVVAIESLVQREDNAIGNQAKWLCSFNVHQYGSVGVLGL